MKEASELCIKLLEHFECSGDVTKYLKGYLCPAGVPTIGIGTTIYPDGTKVTLNDIITKEYAYACLANDLHKIESFLNKVVITEINQNMFDSLISLVYNIGEPRFKKSTLLRLVNENICDPFIEDAFLMWKLVKGKPSDGLIRRRKAEAWLYFNGELKFYF
jgi:lysozyme